MDADRVELLLIALGTVVALWLLLKYEIKESEGRNGKAHNDIRNLIKESEGRNRELIKESEGRNEKAHGELSTRIDNGFNGLNATLMAMSDKMGFISRVAGTRRTRSAAAGRTRSAAAGG